MTVSDTSRAVLVTGASTGIGRAVAARLVASGCDVFASVRRAEDGAALAEALGPRLHPLVFDVRDSEAMQAAAGQVRAALGGRTLAGLVNNAGVALPGPALTQPWDEIATVIDVNLLGAMRACRVFAPLLGADPGLSGPKGRIVNVTSVSGRFGYPFTAAYAASKHGLEGWSASLRRELMRVGIDVVIVGPGAVKTPIWDKGRASGAGQRDADPLWGPPLAALEAGLAAMDAQGLEADAVARTIETALFVRRPRARYAPVRNRLTDWWLPQWLPARLVDRIVAARLGLKPD